MPRINQNRMSLSTVGFTPAVFNPLDYKPEVVDYSILERSFARQEARQAAAAEKSSAVDVALGKIEAELHNDPETQEWFNNYKNNIRQQIANATEVGDYAEAVNVATRLAGQVSSDSSILGRVKANQEYQAKVDEIHKRMLAGQISPDTERWWLANNQFDYKDVTDENGNVIGGTSYSNLNVPVNEINVVELADKAFKLISPNMTDTQTINTNGTGSHTKHQWITRKQLIDNIDDILDKIPGARTAMYQRWQVEMFKYDELVNDENADLNARNMQKARIYRNGSPMSFKEFCVKEIEDSAIINNMPYDYKTTIRDNQPSKKGKGSGNNDEDDITNQDDDTDTGVKGPKVTRRNSSNSQANAKNNANNAGTILTEGN